MEVSYYSVAGIGLKLIHENDSLFKWIDDEIKYYKNEEKEAVCEVSLVHSNTVEVPSGALRCTVDEKEREVYSFEHKMYIIKKNSFVIELDSNNRKIVVSYMQDEQKVYFLLRGFIKWLFIKAAEDKGLVYIHAAAVNYNGKNIILAGDSHSGKSSFVLRFIKKGAKVISDDSILIKGNELLPFTFKSAVDEDFSKRFGIKEELFDVGSYMEKKEFKGADMILFLNIWNNNTSEIKNIDYKTALLGLIRIYRKEFNWEKESTENLKRVFKEYSSLLEHTKCFEFYAGNNEEEVRKELFDFLEELNEN